MELPCLLCTLHHLLRILGLAYMLADTKVVHCAEIFALAIPALFSVLLDPLLSLVDTGGCSSCSNLISVLPRPPGPVCCLQECCLCMMLS